MRTVKIAYPFLLLALLAPATASAQTPPPDERAAAQAMADAAKRASADIEAMYAPAMNAMDGDCKPLDTVPERRELDALTLLVGLILRHNAAAIAPRLGELRTELANVRTADPALIAGRAPVEWGIAIDVDEPASLGADRAVNTIAAHALHDGDLIVIDFGTATTFDLVDYRGAYKGGIIAPGINLSLDALVTAAAKLPRIAIEAPGDTSVIGLNTVSQMHIGIYWAMSR